MKNDLNFNKVTKFIKRLYNIVCDNDFKDIGWTEDGKGFRIYNKEEFMKNTLPYLSRTREYSAFIRQLNLYGFIKLKSGAHSFEEYFHTNFQRGREDLLPYVKNDKDKAISVYENKPRIIDIDPRYLEALDCLNRKNNMLENDICLLKERIDKHECTINGLIEILSRMFQCPKPNDSSFQLLDNQKKFENMRLSHSEDKYKDLRQTASGEFVYNNLNSREIYHLARNNFDFDKNFNDQSEKVNEELKTKDIEKYKNKRDEIFGDSDETNNDIFGDNYF